MFNFTFLIFPSLSILTIVITNNAILRIINLLIGGHNQWTLDNDLMVMYYSCIMYINTKLITASNI